MANTKIPVELSSTPGIVDNSNATAITIDSSENVGIGTSSPLALLDVAVLSSGARRLLVNYADSLITLQGANSSSTNETLRVTGDNLRFATGSGTGTEKMRIDSSGNVGIGRASIAQPSSGATTLAIQGTSTTKGGAIRLYSSDDSVAAYIYPDSTSGLSINTSTSHPMVFRTAGSEAMRIDSSGNVGIGTTSPNGKLTISNSGAGGFEFTPDTTAFSVANSNYIASYDRSASAYRDIVFDLGGAESQSVRFKAGGNVGIGTSSPSTALHVIGTVTASSIAASNSEFAGSGGVGGISLKATYLGATKFQVQNTGNVTISGALSKGSGSFKIDHPLEAKTDTHHLVHSFVEAPKADNIYRGKVDLVDGSATVNIDTIAGMTEGTFVALNTDVQCFTTNESDWDAVKGSVSGNILTISCQNTLSTATVSWLVIGERHDQHMIDTDWTDENGKVIVEPLKGQTE